MLRDRQAAGALARQAARRRKDGSRGPRARRAWRTLTAAGDRGDQHAIAACWQGWLAAPDEELWQALTRWRGPEALTAAVFRAATLEHRDPAQRAAIGEFCARRGLAPGDPVQRALFCLLTGQPAQHRAADPDGRLLAVAYQGADPATRAALREALAATGDADLIWAVAGTAQRAQARPLADHETEYLVRELAGRADWSRLWQLVRQLPVTGAVAAMRHFGEGWRPESERERVHFGRLTEADPDQLARGRDALVAWNVTRVQFEDRPKTCWGGAISADSRQLALVRGELPSDPVAISVHELPWEPAGGGVRPEPVRDEPAAVERMPGQTVPAFAGDALITVRAGLPANRPGAMLIRYPGARFEPLAGLQAALGDSGICGMAPCFDPPGGFAVVCENFVAFCHGDGTLARRMPIALDPWRGMSGHSRVDVEPGGQVALSGYLVRAPGGANPGWGWEAYDISSGRILASGQGERRGIRLLGPGRLVAADGAQLGHVRLWEFGSGPAQCRAARTIPYACDVAVVPGDRRISVLGAGNVHVLDAATLQQTGTLGWHGTSGDALTWRFPGAREFVTAQWNSLGNTAWVTAGRGFADVFRGKPMVSGIVDRAPAEWVPGDLVAVTAALADSALAPAARPLLQLLRDELEDRFGTEVTVGTAAPVPGRDDIGLAADGDRSW